MDLPGVRLHTNRQPQRIPRRARRSVVVLIAAALLVTATACDVAVAGRRCTGSGFGRDATHILQCKNRKWTRIMTLGQYAELMARVQAEQERAASSAARAEVTRGTSAWVDVYDWSPTWVNFKSPGATAPFTLDRIDRMADAGITALWIQTAKVDFGTDVLDRDLLNRIISRARSKGMKVFGWYLPTFENPAVDQNLLAKTAELGLDGIGVDIESTVVDLATRNARLVSLSQWLRAAYPSMPLGAIVLPPVVTEVLNLNYWPQFPWTELAPFYDVWMPMGYWTNRSATSEWRDAFRYTTENIDRIRTNLNNPNAPIHAIGGLSNTSSIDDVNRFVFGAKLRGAYGGGLYDDMISTADQYRALAPFRG